MRTSCSLCGCEIYLSIDEFLEVEQDRGQELYCDDCAKLIIDYCVEMQLKSN